MKVIKIGEHHVAIPTPNAKDEILFVNQKKENAYWQRLGPNDLPIEIDPWPRIWFEFIPYFTKINQKYRLYNEDGVLTHITEDDTKLIDRLLLREMDRRRNGVHFKNGNDILWMCGDYYFNLQWAPMHGLSSLWGSYRHFQNDTLILKWHVDNDPDIAGGFWAKPKKTGITQIFAGAEVNESTMIAQKIFAFMSKTGDDVVDTNMMYYFFILDHLPPIFRPKIKKQNEHEIIYGIPPKRSTGTTGSLVGQFSNNKEHKLDTRVYASKTKESGFDGPLIWRGWIDEFPKLWEGSKVSPGQVYKKTIETVAKQHEIVGKLYYTSYVIENDDKGFFEARSVWKKSKLATKSSDTRRTESNMICHLITVQESTEGLFDQHGRCNQKEAFYMIDSRVKAASDSSDKQRLKRQYPTNEADAWDSGGSGSTFDNIRLGLRKRELDEMMRAGQMPWKEQGRLVWDNSAWESGLTKRPEGKFTTVSFEALTFEEQMEDKKARMKIFQDIPYDLQNRVIKANYRHEEDDELCPFPDNEIVNSWDPTEYVLKQDVKVGSKHSSHTFNLFNPAVNTRYRRVASNIPLFNYFHRPNDPDEAYEDMVKLIIYTGGMVIVEANKAWMLTRLKKDNLHWFILLLDKDGVIRPYVSDEDLKLTNTTRDVIEAYCRAINRWLKAPRNKDDVDYTQYLNDPEDIDQLMNFDPLETKKFDKVVSIGYARLAVESYSAFKETQETELPSENALKTLENILSL